MKSKKLRRASPSLPRSTAGSLPGDRPDTGRYSSQRKVAAVLRLLRGESLDALSRELRVTAARLVEWRDAFLAGGQTSLKSREADDRDQEILRLKAAVGDLTMRNELLRERARALEAGLPLDRRRSRC